MTRWLELIFICHLSQWPNVLSFSSEYLWYAIFSFFTLNISICQVPGEFHEQRSLVGCSPWGHKELDTTEWLTLSLNFLIMGQQQWNRSGRLSHAEYTLAVKKSIWIWLIKEDKQEYILGNRVWCLILCHVSLCHGTQILGQILL